MNNDSRKIWENIFQISQAVFRVTHLFPKEEILRRHLRAKITEILYQSSQNFPSSFCHSDSPAGGEESQNYENLIKEIHNFRSLLFTTKNCNFVDEKNIVVLIKECENLLENLDKFSVCHPRSPLCHPSAGGDPDLYPTEFISKISAPVIASSAKQSRSQQFNTESVSSPHPLLSSARMNRSDGSPRMRGPRPLQTTNYKPQTNQPAQSDIGFFVPNIRQQKIIDYFKRNDKEKIRLKDVADEFRNIAPRTVRSDLRELCDNGHLIRNGNGAGSFYCLSNNAS